MLYGKTTSVKATLMTSTFDYLERVPFSMNFKIRTRGAAEDAAGCERAGTLLVSFIPLLSTPSFCHNTYYGQFPYIPLVNTEHNKMDLSNL